MCRGDIDFKDKNGSRKRLTEKRFFEFVNGNCKAGRRREKFLQRIETYRIRLTVSSHIRLSVYRFSQQLSSLCSTYPRQRLGTWIADWLVAWIETFQGWVGGLMENANPLLYALLVDGIIGGVGAVVGFLPLVMVMYFLIALLEDCGYMAKSYSSSGSDF